MKTLLRNSLLILLSVSYYLFAFDDLIQTEEEADKQIMKYEAILTRCEKNKKLPCTEIYSFLGRLYLIKFNFVNKRTAHLKISENKECIETGNKAVQSYKEVINKSKDQFKIGEAYYQIATISLILSNLDISFQYFNHLVHKHRKHPRASAAHFRLGELYYMNKKYRKARYHFKRVIPKYVTPEAMCVIKYRQAEMLFYKKKFEESKKMFSEICSRNCLPDDLSKECESYLKNCDKSDRNFKN